MKDGVRAALLRVSAASSRTNRGQMAEYAGTSRSDSTGGAPTATTSRCDWPADSDTATEVEAPARLDWSIDLDLEAVRARTPDLEEYGRHLTERLFADCVLRQTFNQVRTEAVISGLTLRVRLAIGSTAPELQRSFLETLYDPLDGVLVVRHEHLIFSRYSSSPDWRAVRTRTQREPRALVVIASPTNLHDYLPGGRPLLALSLADERHKAERALGEVSITWLEAAGRGTLASLIDTLRAGYDIVYLVCSGATIDGRFRSLAGGRTG